MLFERVIAQLWRVISLSRSGELTSRTAVEFESHSFCARSASDFCAVSRVRFSHFRPTSA